MLAYGMIGFDIDVEQRRRRAVEHDRARGTGQRRDLTMRSAEIRRCRLLPRRDDRAADLAGAGEELLHARTVADAHHALQLAEVFDETAKPGKAWVCRIDVKLKDGRTLNRTLTDFSGSPTKPMSKEDFDGKFRASTRDLGREASARLLDGLTRLEAQPSVAKLMELAAA